MPLKNYEYFIIWQSLLPAFYCAVETPSKHEKDTAELRMGRKEKIQMLKRVARETMSENKLILQLTLHSLCER